MFLLAARTKAEGVATLCVRSDRPGQTKIVSVDFSSTNVVISTYFRETFLSKRLPRHRFVNFYFARSEKSHFDN
jgi:hypothetical protein